MQIGLELLLQAQLINGSDLIRKVQSPYNIG